MLGTIMAQIRKSLKPTVGILGAFLA